MVVFVVTLVAKFLKFLGKVSSFIDVTIALIVVIGFVCITQCVCVCVCMKMLEEAACGSEGSTTARCTVL